MTKSQIADKLGTSLSTLRLFMRSPFFSNFTIKRNGRVMIDGIASRDYIIDLSHLKNDFKKYKNKMKENKYFTQKWSKKYQGILKNETSLTTEEYLEERKNEAKL